jgi:CRISPR-associated protein Cas5 subtype I-B
MPKLAAFDIGSSFGYFRKSFTTTNALTHAVIPRSSLEGLIASILGLGIHDYQEKLKQSLIAVQIMSLVRKLNMKYMHTNPDWWQNVLSPYLYNKKSSSKVMPKFAVPKRIHCISSFNLDSMGLQK